MGKSQWENLGEDILNSVFEAADTGDFSNLSKNVEDLVNVTFDKVGGAVKNGINQAQTTYEKQKQAGAQYYKDWQKNQQNKWQQSVQNPQGMRQGTNGAYLQRNGNTPQAQGARLQGQYRSNIQAPALYKKNVPGKYAGPILTIFGGIGTGLFAVGTIGFGIAAIASHPMLIPAGIFAAITTIFAGMTGSGSRITKRNQRFKEYVRCLGTKGYCRIEELSAKVGKSVKYVTKDVKKMMSMGYFLQGHMDQGETTLIASNEVYEQYTASEMARIEREAESRRLEAEAHSPKGEVNKLIREGERYIAHIHECNAAIPGEEISAKLQRLEDVMIRIFEHLKHSPESAGDLGKMMNYYLPTTTKLIDTYRDLDAKPEIGDNIKKTKQEIEDTLDTINFAFEKIFDDMFLDTAWDISSDISVMKTMMAQEGLTQQ